MFSLNAFGCIVMTLLSPPQLVFSPNRFVSFVYVWAVCISG
jgi:hypothetical protein